MSEILLTVRVPPLLSPRTAKYVAAMVREGDSFDYRKWLNSVREEEAHAQQAQTAITPGDLVAARGESPISVSDFRARRPFTGRPLICKPGLNLRALHRSHRQAKNQIRKARLRQWLEKVRRAWGEFQASRTRDAVYGYLEAVFAIIEHYRVRRKTNRLLRHAFEFANLPFDENADPFSVVIRCTCGNTVDSKAISKWSRALRYVRSCKKHWTPVRKFMKASGGINACAARYAKLMRRV